MFVNCRYGTVKFRVFSQYKGKPPHTSYSLHDLINIYYIIVIFSYTVWVLYNIIIIIFFSKIKKPTGAWCSMVVGHSSHVNVFWGQVSAGVASSRMGDHSSF